MYALFAPFYDLVQALPSRRGSPEFGLRSPAFITLLMATDMNIQYHWVRDDIHTTFERMIYSW